MFRLLAPANCPVPTPPVCGPTAAFTSPIAPITVSGRSVKAEEAKPVGAFALEGQLVTGMLYLDPKPEDLHRHLNTCDAPLNRLSENEVCPGSAALEKINARLR
jgi:hypothetical protein